MGGDDDRASVSAWVPTDVLEEFDRMFDCGPDGANSRSEELVELMQDCVEIERVIQSTEYEFGHRAARRAWLRQAIWDLYRREQDRDSDT